MISIKTSAEIEIMAEGGKILAQIMKELEKMVQPGIKTQDLDKVAKDLVFKFGAKPSFLGYQDFPAVLCVSVNEEIVHGVPSDRILKQGDIISLDLGIFYKGFHTDMAVTVPVGTISKEAQKLIQVTKEALNLGISEVRPGNTFSDIGRAIQKYVEGHGFGVVRELCGHGIGKEVHEEPQVLNYLLENSEKDDIEIKEGMVFCIEPMVTEGDWRLKKTEDGYGYQTKDGSFSCHFEYTLAVTRKSYQLLTKI